MRCLVFSDIHGNLPAFEKVLKNESNIDVYINLGDVVNYGPWNNECVDLIESLNCLNLLGNHEEYFIRGECDVKNDIVQAFFRHNYATFDRVELIKNYKRKIVFNKFLMTHNLLKKGYIYRDTKVKIKMDTMIGHSHQQYHRLENQFNLINPGSIGQNRDNLAVCNYIIWDTNKNNFLQKELYSDPMNVINELKNRNFPEICINYYKNKLR